MFSDNVAHQGFGGTNFTQRDPERASRVINRLNQPGCTVTFRPGENAT